MLLQTPDVSVQRVTQIHQRQKGGFQLCLDLCLRRVVCGVRYIAAMRPATTIGLVILISPRLPVEVRASSTSKNSAADYAAMQIFTIWASCSDCSAVSTSATTLHFCGI